MQRNCEIVVCSDVMYVNIIALFVSTSRAMKFGTAEAPKDRKIETQLTNFKSIKATYGRQGFFATRMVGGNDFATQTEAMSIARTALNVVTVGEHVPEIERHIRTLKERCRTTFNTLQFKRIHNRMIVEMLHCMKYWLHA